VVLGIVVILSGAEGKVEKSFVWWGIFCRLGEFLGDGMGCKITLILKVTTESFCDRSEVDKIGISG